MKYIKNGKLVLDGTIRECDLQDKLNKALEIIVDSGLYIGPSSIPRRRITRQH